MFEAKVSDVMHDMLRSYQSTSETIAAFLNISMLQLQVSGDARSMHNQPLFLFLTRLSVQSFDDNQ